MVGLQGCHKGRPFTRPAPVTAPLPRLTPDASPTPLPARLQVLLTSHLGRPKKGPEDKFRLNPVQPRLAELLGQAVEKADDCIGEAVTSKLANMANGSVSGL